MHARLTHRFIAALLVLPLLASSVLIARPAAADTLPWRDKSSPFGMVTAIANRVRDDEIDRYVGLLSEAGVQWTREEFFWHEVQKEPGGPLDWDGNDQGMYNYDHSIAALGSAGINVLGLIDYNPAWTKGQNPSLDSWIQAWGDYVYQVVARYGRGGPIRYWEIWNEPNLTQFGYQAGLYTIQDYVRILDVARTAVKAADPNAVIVLGGLASIYDYPPSPTTYDYFDYLEALGQLGAWEDFDILAIHPYRADAPEGTVLRRDQASPFSEEMRRLDDLMLRYGARPVWFTEVGWATDRGYYGVSEDQQAQFLQRFYVMALAHPSVEKIFWYTFRNDTDKAPSYEQPVYNEFEHEFHFGLLRRKYPLDANDPSLRKPAFIAYRTMTNLLSGLTLQEARADGTRSDMPATYWYRFGGGKRVDVLWNTDRADQVVMVDCGCQVALMRHWNGSAKYLLTADNGMLTVKLDEQGSPSFLEFDPPVASGGVFFEETGHSVRGSILAYWRANGGLERFGYPLTEEITEPDASSGMVRTVQYFERARLEYGPSGIQLGRLGDTLLRRYGVQWDQAPRVETAPADCLLFSETGHTLCPPFRARWAELGGATLMGLPLGEPFSYVRPDGVTVTAQYFERARMELKPDGGIELGLLGRELLTP